MFVELIYDKRNTQTVLNANERILFELTKRVHGTFPDATVRVKPMVTLSSINTDASKAQKAILVSISEGYISRQSKDQDTYLITGRENE